MAGGFKVSYPTLYSIVTSLPGSGATGQMVFNSSDSNLYIYYDGAWHVVGSGGGVGGTFDYTDGSDLQFIDGTYFDYVT